MGVIKGREGKRRLKEEKSSKLSREKTNIKKKKRREDKREKLWKPREGREKIVEIQGKEN